MLRRTLEKRLRLSASQYPVVSLTGPRQSGKTTLVRDVFAEYDYVSLEHPEQRAFALEDPKGFLGQFRGKVILDEVQRTPELFSYIQPLVDERDAPGQFILTGSQNFLLLRNISQTLAGRCAVLHLLPLALHELQERPPFPLEDLGRKIPPQAQKATEPLFDLLFRGFYPRIYDKNLDPQDWLRNYHQAYLERDVRDLANVGDLEVFSRFVRLCAGRNGQLLNLSSLSVDCGVSHTTARRWLSILEASFLVVLLRPHFQNFNKRLVKTPKLYFLDTGLLCYLLRIPSAEELRFHPHRGAIFESFVVSEFFKNFLHQGLEPGLFFWRDSSGHEVDLLVEKGSALIPVEIKSGETFNPDFFAGIDYWRKLAAQPQGPAALVYAGEESYKRREVGVYSWKEL